VLEHLDAARRLGASAVAVRATSVIAYLAQTTATSP
jgi:hypothetical protein